MTPGGVFADCHVVLELSSALNFKQKKAIKEAVTKHGGVISYIITKKVRVNKVHEYDGDSDFATFYRHIKEHA